MEITKEIISAFMVEHNIKRLPLFATNDEYVGTISKNFDFEPAARIAYDYGRHSELRKNALYIAIQNFPITKELYERWNKETEVSVEEYVDDKLKRIEVFKGTLDSIFEQIDKAENALRYVNGHYFRIADKHIKRLMRYWERHIPLQRSFDNYYLGSFVD